MPKPAGRPRTAKERMVSRSFPLPPELDEYIENLSSERNVSRGEILRTIIEYYKAQHPITEKND